MPYSDVAALAVDQDFANRTIAAYATETLDDLNTNPPIWQRDNAWKMASAPGFGDAYAYAIAAGNERPGNDPAVITDAMILSAVQAVMGLSAPEVPQEPEVDPEPPPEEPVMNPLDGGTDAETV